MSLSCSFLVFDKPEGLTSHDIVGMFRAVTGVKKVGHTGTLDPFATGVLPLALGSATRLIRFLDEDLKVYDATIALGASTDTGDPTGEVIRTLPVPALDRAHIESVLSTFLGNRMQVPPRYSAVKVRGRRLYEYARKGEEVEAQPRPVRIDGAEILEMGEAEIRVLLTCSRGTYARVLADEIAQALGTAGHLRRLSRRQSGPFKLDRALPVQDLSQIVAGTADWESALRVRPGQERVPWNPRDQVHQALEAWRIPALDALGHLQPLVVSPAVGRVIRRGGPVPAPPPGVKLGESFLVVAADALVAVASSKGGGACEVLWREGDDEPRGRGSFPGGR